MPVLDTPGRVQITAGQLAELVKVGPHGYIHGWIFVGIPGVGGEVQHPHLGHGHVIGVGNGKVRVRFDSGAEHSFEHHAGTGRAGGGSGGGHFEPRGSGSGSSRPAAKPSRRGEQGDLLSAEAPTPRAGQTGGRDWTAMRRQDFDEGEPLSLFDVPGTRQSRRESQAQHAANGPDLLDLAAEEPKPAQPSRPTRTITVGSTTGNPQEVEVEERNRDISDAAMDASYASLRGEAGGVRVGDDVSVGGVPGHVVEVAHREGQVQARIQHPVDDTSNRYGGAGYNTHWVPVSQVRPASESSEETARIVAANAPPLTPGQRIAGRISFASTLSSRHHRDAITGLSDGDLTAVAAEYARREAEGRPDSNGSHQMVRDEIAHRANPQAQAGPLTERDTAAEDNAHADLHNFAYHQAMRTHYHESTGGDLPAITEVRPNDSGEFARAVEHLGAGRYQQGIAGLAESAQRAHERGDEATAARVSRTLARVSEDTRKAKPGRLALGGIGRNDDGSLNAVDNTGARWHLQVNGDRVTATSHTGVTASAKTDPFTDATDAARNAVTSATRNTAGQSGYDKMRYGTDHTAVARGLSDDELANAREHLDHLEYGEGQSINGATRVSLAGVGDPHRAAAYGSGEVYAEQQARNAAHADALLQQLHYSASQGTHQQTVTRMSDRDLAVAGEALGRHETGGPVKSVARQAVERERARRRDAGNAAEVNDALDKAEAVRPEWDYATRAREKLAAGDYDGAMKDLTDARSGAEQNGSMVAAAAYGKAADKVRADRGRKLAEARESAKDARARTAYRLATDLHNTPGVEHQHAATRMARAAGLIEAGDLKGANEETRDAKNALARHGEKLRRTKLPSNATGDTRAWHAKRVERTTGLAERADALNQVIARDRAAAYHAAGGPAMGRQGPDPYDRKHLAQMAEGAGGRKIVTDLTGLPETVRRDYIDQLTPSQLAQANLALQRDARRGHAAPDTLALIQNAMQRMGLDEELNRGRQ